MTLEVHDLANLIPSMTDAEYAVLRDDIKEDGLIQPITLYEGKILDGRHRYKACEELGVDCRHTDFTGSDPVRYIISLNVHRRHLTVAQRAIVALAAHPYYKEQAYERKQESGRHSGRGQNRSGPKDPHLLKRASKRRAFTQAAEDVGLGRSTVQRLARLQDEAPDLYEKVASGDLTVHGADKIFHDRQPEPFSRGKFRKRDKSKPYLITSGKAQIDADAAKRKLAKVIYSLVGYAEALDGFDTQRAMAGATPDELDDWVKRLVKAISVFNKLRATIKEGVSK